MTREQFEHLMLYDGWSPRQRAMWAEFTPVCDADTFRRGMAKPDGIVWSERVTDSRLMKLRWKRFFSFLFRLAA